MSGGRTQSPAPLPRLWGAFARRMSPPVFLGSAAVVPGFLAFGAGFTDTARRVFPALQRFTVEHFGWVYVLTATLIELIPWTSPPAAQLP